MTEERIRRIEARIEKATHLPAAEREELLKLVSTLRDEVGTLAKSHQDDARSVTHFLDASTHEVSRTQRRPKLLETALHGLTASIEDFEGSHPKLVETVQQVAVVLTNMGL